MSMAEEYALRLKTMIEGPPRTSEDFLSLLRDMEKSAVWMRLGPAPVWIFTDRSMLKKIDDDDDGNHRYEYAEWQGVI